MCLSIFKSLDVCRKRISQDFCIKKRTHNAKVKLLRCVTAGVNPAFFLERKKNMKKFILLICFSFLSLVLYAHGSILTEHSKIKELSSFIIMGEIELRTEKDCSSQVKYRTLSHEGGMKVTVLEILKNDVQDKGSGKWLYVLLTAPMWVDSGEWIEKYQKFLIFLPDDMPIFNFEE